MYPVSPTGMYAKSVLKKAENRRYPKGIGGSKIRKEQNEYNLQICKYYLQNKKGVCVMLDRIALILVTIGALNWGSIGLFKFDLVAWLFGGQAAIMSRIVYVIVALAGIWCISLLFRENEMVGTVMADDTTNE